MAGGGHDRWVAEMVRINSIPDMHGHERCARYAGGNRAMPATSLKMKRARRKQGGMRSAEAYPLSEAQNDAPEIADILMDKLDYL